MCFMLILPWQSNFHQSIHLKKGNIPMDDNYEEDYNELYEWEGDFFSED
jgi:hypothetical protein